MSRTAFGAQRHMSPEEKARNVALSIHRHQFELTDATWARYGLLGNRMQQARVRMALVMLQGAT